MPRTATKKNETRQEQQARELAEIGKSAYAVIAEMVGKLTVSGQDEDGDDIEATDEEREAAREAILEDALSVEVRSDWHTPGETTGAPSDFVLLLGTGGPAIRIRGELDDNAEPRRAWLETQDWGTPWTQYIDADQDVLLAYARCFYFGEG